MDQAVAHTELLTTADSPVVGTTNFASMGNTAHVVVVGADESSVSNLLGRARKLAESLENSWSRFIPSSDIARLNTARGRAVRISTETEVLIRYLVAAADVTDGLFDPFVLPALVKAGYDTSLAGDGRKSCIPMPTTMKPSASDIVIESIDGTTFCRLLGAATLDPGGLGKGLAADIIAERLVLDGATGVLVSMGGDIRCIGESPDPTGWVVEIEALAHPAFGPTTVVLQSGAIASSTTFAKRWYGGHHVIDPTTGEPLDECSPRALRMSSVIASTAAWAEVFATATLVAGADCAGLIIEARGLAARFERADGRVILTPGFARFAR